MVAPLDSKDIPTIRITYAVTRPNPQWGSSPMAAVPNDPMVSLSAVSSCPVC
jgi:hypothetical protein